MWEREKGSDRQSCSVVYPKHSASVQGSLTLSDSATVWFGGLPCVLPGQLREEVDRWNLENPAYAIPIEHWWGRANSFQCFTGPEPGRGHVLMLWRDLQFFNPNALQPLEFRMGNSVILPSLVAVKAIKVAGNIDDPDAVYVVELADRRYHARRSAIDLQVNVTAPEGTTYFGTRQPSVGAGQPAAGPPEHDWQSLLQALWVNVPPLGPFPGFPATWTEPNADPRDWRWPHENAYDALNVVLRHLHLVLVYDPVDDAFRLDMLGDSAQLAVFIQTLETWQEYLWDAGPKEPLSAKVPGTLRVCFHSRDWTYGTDQTVPTTQDAWQLRPSRSIDVPMSDGIPGTVEIVWEDLPADFSIDGRWVNQSECESRAVQRASAFIQEVVQGRFWGKRVYSGLCGGQFRPAGVLACVAWHELGDGLKTTILNQPRAPAASATGDIGSLISLEHETITAPDIARPTIPFQRFAWVELVDSIKAKGCGDGVVLKGVETYETEEEPCGVDWVACRTPNGPLTIQVQNVTDAEFKSGDRVLASWHWQAQRWTIVSGGGGKSGLIYARLIDRQGIGYSWYQVRSICDGCNWEPVPNGFSGVKNAYDINCSSHNSYGPAVDLIVELHGPFICEGSDIPYWLFDYAGTNEFDDERFPFIP